MQCAGIPGKINVRGLQVSSEGLTTLLAWYNLVNAQFCHKDAVACLSQNHLKWKVAPTVFQHLMLFEKTEFHFCLQNQVLWKTSYSHMPWS
jgi:hypothetical protein